MDESRRESSVSSGSRRLLRTRDHSVTARSAGLLAEAIRAGRSPVDGAFDRWLPRELRAVSDQYWTPLPVIRRVASWLQDLRVRTVVDIGSGAGKFCVASALLSPCRFVGVEKRSSLVNLARSLALAFGVDDRVLFLKGDFGLTPTPEADAYYLFNPFGDYAFGSPGFTDPGVSFSRESGDRDVRAVVQVLTLAPPGTVVITYNGFGGRLPSSYEQIDVDVTLPRALRLWRKTRLSTQPTRAVARERRHAMIRPASS